MNITTVVKNIVHEVTKEFNIESTVKVEVRTDNGSYKSMEYYIISKDLEQRGVYVQSNNGIHTVSHGFHSPSDNKSDLIQLIIVGRVAERLLKENLK